MPRWVGRTFTGARDRGGGRLEGLELVRCRFESCSLAWLPATPEARTVVRDVSLIDGVAVNCLVGPALVDEVTVDGLKVNDMLAIAGAVFRHVTFKGTIAGGLRIHPRATLGRVAEAEARFARSRRAFYQEVDWALDLSAARFGGEVPCTACRRGWSGAPPRPRPSSPARGR